MVLVGERVGKGGEVPRAFSGPRGYARARRLGPFQVLPSTFAGPIGLCHGQASRTFSGPRLCHMTTLHPRLNVLYLQTMLPAA